MGKSTIFSDVVVMALLFNRDVNKLVTMISYEKVKNFDDIINKNLDDFNIKISYPFLREETSKFYFYATDEDGKKYLVMNPEADIESARSYHIGTLPVDILVAAEKNNALAAIGLQLIDGKFRKL